MAYTDVNFMRERMKDALLTGETTKLVKRGALSKFEQQPDYLADAKRRLLAGAAARQREKEASEAREQAARYEQFENADWIL